MKHEQGNMWNIWDETQHFIFTGNSFIKMNGALVMGRGIAKEVRDKFPGIDHAIGTVIHNHLGKYGVILGSKIGVFQVKYNFADQADLDLISYSVSKLTVMASEKPQERFDMNYPGIGNGKLNRELVEPLLAPLPANVHIWSFQ